MIRRVARVFLESCCVYCNDRIPGGYSCARCEGILPRLAACCARCAKPLPGPASLCGQCQRRPPPFFRARAGFLYAFPVDEALKALKFRSRLYFAPALAAAVVDTLLSDFGDADALVPVPLHRWRHAVRGFNQAQELCRPLARATGLPVVANVYRSKATETQSGLSRAGRRRNLAGAFRMRGRLRSRCPLIVDDVMTTGETCGQLALTLLQGGAERVGVLVVARA